MLGNRARVGTLEWRIPLKDIDRHAMVPPVGMNRLVGYRFGANFLLGVAEGRDEGGKTTAYLRIGRSF